MTGTLKKGTRVTKHGRWPGGDLDGAEGAGCWPGADLDGAAGADAWSPRRTGLSKTDIVNRAITLYEFIEGHLYGASSAPSTVGWWAHTIGHVAQKIQTLFIDDIDGSEAEGTVRFGIRMA